MADIAVLGLEVRSDQVKKGAADLDRLTAAAKKAEAAADGVAASSERAAKATANISTATSKARMQWESYDEVVARTGAKIRDGAKAADVAAKSVSRQAAAANDAAGKVEAHGNAVERAAKKTERASLVANGFAFALGRIKQALAGLVLNAIAVGLGVLMAELAKLVNWAGLAASALYALADAIEIVAPYAAMAAAGLALLYAPAIIGGIVQVIALLARLAVAAVAAAAALAAANPAAAFVLGITAAVAAANIFRDELTTIFGVDIVGAAKTGANYVIGSFVAAYEDIKFVWNNFPTIMGAAITGAVNFVIRGVNKMVNSAIDGINKLISGLNSLASFFGADKAVQFFGFSGKISEIDPWGGISEMDNPAAADLSVAADARNTAVQSALSRDYVGQIGDAVDSMASSAAAKLRELAGSFGGVEDAAGKAGRAAKGAAEKAKDPWKGLREAVDKVSDGMKFARDVVGGFVSDLRAGLKNGESFWESFKKAASNAIDKIVDKLINNMLDAIFQVGSATTGGGGGFLGGLFSFLGFANGGVFQGGRVTPFARGGVVSRPTLFPMANGAGLMGEAGPEAIMPLRRGPDGRLGVSAANGNAQPQTLHVTVGVSVDDDGKIKAYVTDMGQQAAKAGAQLGVRQVNQSLPSMLANAQSRSM